MNAPKNPDPSAAPATSGWQLPTADQGARWLPHALLGTVAAFCAIAFLWAALAELDEVTRGDGRVIAASQVQLVQNLEGGIVSQILVKEGDVVAKDQVLLRIDDTRFASAFREGQQTNLTLRARIARLEAESGHVPMKMPEDVVRGNRALAAQESMLYESRRRELAAKNGVLQQQLVQRQSELSELRTRVERLGESFALINKEIALTAPMVKQGIVSEVELLRQEREATRIRTELDGARQAIPRVESAIEEAKKRKEENEFAFRSQAGAELALAQGEATKTAESIPALEDRVSRTTVRSPVRGTVKVMLVKTVGGVVQPGSPMAEIVPFEDTLLVETRIRPSDIAFVTIGQRAVVKLSAYDYSIYGALEGRIEHVSADSVQPPQGEPYYIAHVRASAGTLQFRGKPLQVIPGMTASVDVLTGRKTVLYYLLKPINRARERALSER